MKNRTDARNRKPTLEHLEGRALLATLAEVNATHIQIERDRFTTKSDLGDLNKSFQSSVVSTSQSAADTARTLYNDYFDLKQQEIDDSQAGDKEAVKADRAQEAIDLQQYRLAVRLGQQARAIGNQVNRGLNGYAGQEDRFANQALGALRNGGNPTNIGDRIDARSSLVEDRAGQYVDNASARLGSIQAQLDQLSGGGSNQTFTLSGTYTAPVNQSNGQPFTSALSATEVQLIGSTLSGNLLVSNFPTVSGTTITGSTPNVNTTFTGLVDAAGNITNGQLLIPGQATPFGFTGSLKNGQLTLNLTNQGVNAGTAILS